jgi:hypothetical protein
MRKEGMVDRLRGWGVREAGEPQKETPPTVFASAHDTDKKRKIRRASE